MMLQISTACLRFQRNPLEKFMILRRPGEAIAEQNCFVVEILAVVVGINH